MNRLISLMLVIAVSLFSVTSYAAFQIQQENKAASGANSHEQVVVKRSEIRNAMKISPTPAPHNLSGSDVGLIFGILALIFGIISLVASPVAGIIFAAAAIIIGLLGLDRPWSGLSLAGLILGIVGGVVALVRLVA